MHVQSNGGMGRTTGKEFLAHAKSEELPVGLVTRDNDRNYRPVFEKVFTDRGIQVKPHSYRAPNLNAYVERFIQTIQVECLNHFLIFSEKHFDYLAREYVEHYHNDRPHQGLGYKVLVAEPPPQRQPAADW